MEATVEEARKKKDAAKKKLEKTVGTLSASGSVDTRAACTEGDST